ncbi:hypothetical protein Tco_0591045 [Tanacetum coccineum]
MAPSNEEVLVEDQPYGVADSPIALSPSYVANSDPEEDHADYPADGGEKMDKALPMKMMMILYLISGLLEFRLPLSGIRMDDPNITMEEYIRLEEEKAQKRGKVFNWETAKYGKIWYDEDIHDLRSVETEFPAIAFIDEVSSEKTLSCEPTVSSLNDEIDFRVSFDDSDDEDYTVIFDKNSFSYKKISTNDLKTDSENDNEKVMPSLPSPEPTVSCFDDLDFFKDFENEFPAIVYNDAQTSKSDLLTEPILSPQHIDEFDLNDETSLSEYKEEEQNVLYFNDLFPFNIIHSDDLKSEKDNDDNDIDIIQSLGVANAIEAIAIYETKTNMACKSVSQTKRQEDKVADNASNKRKWEGNHDRSSSQQNKGHKVPRAHTTRTVNKKAYAGSLPLCNQCKFHHNGPCIVKCGNCKNVGHITQNCKTLAAARNQQTRTCYEYGSLRHYKSECPIVKFHNCMDMIHERVMASKPNIMQDEIEFATKLMDKKISSLAEC